MTKHVILFVGLPGAGKTVLAEKVRREYPQQAIVMDDPSVDARNGHLEWVIARCSQHPIVLITDPNLVRLDICKAREVVRTWFGPDVQVGVVLFAPDLEASQANISARNDNRIITNDTLDTLFNSFGYANWGYGCINAAVPAIWTNTYQGNLYNVE